MNDYVSLNKLAKIFKEQGLDSSLKQENGQIENIKGVSLFEKKDGKNKLNEDLLTKDGFINTLYDDSDNDDTKKVSKEELALIYDALSSISTDGKVSEKELKLLAEAGLDRNKIDKSDIRALVNKANYLYESQERLSYTRSSDAVFKRDNRIKRDKDGKKYVNVEGWSEKGNRNDCLSKIIQNSYDLNKMGIKIDSSEYKALEKAIMDANPDIYNGKRMQMGGTGRNYAVLYTNEKVYLPDYNKQTPKDRGGGQGIDKYSLHPTIDKETLRTLDEEQPIRRERRS